MKAIALAAILLTAVGVRANQVLEWNELLIDTVRGDNSGPNLSSRNLAILHTAIFDAVNAITGARRPYRFAVPLEGEASVEAAAAGAAHEVISALYPVAARRADKIVAPFSDTNGLALGRMIARMALRSRENDGINADKPYIPSAEPGQWRRTPPYFRPPATPQWRDVTLFALPEKESFVSPPPPALGSPEFLSAVNEVKTLGGKISSVRTPEQTLIAKFWSDFSYTSMPPGHWHQIAASICRDRHVSLEDSARLFALLSVAQADAAIICWETKYRYNLWRPVTAIQREDKKWDALLPAPPFPAYTSGHSTFSKASAEILTHFFGSDDIAFSARSDTVPNVIRNFASFSECADEIGMSRIYGGIHYSFDNEMGKATGQRIGKYVAANFLLPR